jgi:hypothetical protein
MPEAVICKEKIAPAAPGRLTGQRRRKPLLTVAAVAAEVGVDCTSEQIRRAIESGQVGWAWAIGLSRSRRSEVRILRHSAEHYARTLGLTAEPSLTWAEVVGMILPGEGPVYPSAQLVNWWSADPQLGLGLIKAGYWRAVGSGGKRGGRGATPLVTRESVVEFLKQRRIA